MLVEIHLLQNHSPSNPNRDDLGAPKTAWFGGKPRGRISSQCIKRSIRWWPEFQEALKGNLGTRTKIFPELVGERLKRSSITDPDEQRNIVNACKRIAKAEGKEEKVERGRKADPRAKTPQLIFLQPGHEDEFVRNLEKLRAEKKDAFDFFCNPVAVFKQQVADYLEDAGADEKEAKKITDAAWLVAKLRVSKLFRPDEPTPPGWDAANPDPIHVTQRLRELQEHDEARFKEVTKRPVAAEREQLKDAAPKPSNMKEFFEALYAPMRLNAVDIALFGRMTTSDAFEDVEAAVEVAHAISTNALQQEVDYFTAVDDKALPGTGAAHVSENQFNSCTYYKYFSIDWNGLVSRLAGKNPTPEQLDEATKLASKALVAFIEAAWHAIPTGKKKGHANNDQPSAVLVEVKERRIPTSYANAFVKPAATTNELDLIEDSINKLGQYVGCTARSSGIAVKKRIWLAARGEPLEFIEPDRKIEPGRKSADSKPKQVDAEICASLSEVVGQTLSALGLAAPNHKAGDSK